MTTERFDTHRRSHWRTFLSRAGVLLLVFFTLLPSAFADHRTDDITAQFSELQVVRRDHRVIVRYEITPASWRALDRANIEPRLNFYSLDRSKDRYVYRYSSKVRNRVGKVIYRPKDVRLRDSRTVEVRLVGFGGPKRIARSSYNRQTSNRLRLAIQDQRERACEDDAREVRTPRHRDQERPGVRGRRGATRAQIIQACDAHTRFDSELNGCLTRADRLPAESAVPVIEACGEATQFASDFRKCLDAAAGLAVAPAKTIEACAAVTSFGTELHQCLAVSAAYTQSSPAGVIRACGRHTSFGSGLKQCIGSARKVRGNRVQVVNACGQATTFDGELVGCVARSRHRRT